ncbi:hypothetical protein FB451DRAFT_1409210 [Mycena latifolia]|nr:hypothetical protein FB451DRAFT_1409210 [Mycena latifolia]
MSDATLTLINATQGPACLPWAPHVVHVTQALHHYITNETQTQTHNPPSSLAAAHDTHDDTPTPAPAMYAVIADPHRKSPSPIMLPDKHCPSRSASRSPRRLETAHIPRVVLRFDLKLGFTPVRADSAEIYLAIEEALSMAGPLSGVHWSHRGNLVLHPALNKCTEKFLLLCSAQIWDAICPLLKLPDNCPCPLFEVNKPWHSVVFHGIPRPSSTGSIDCEGMELWLRTDKHLIDTVKVFSILCRPEEFTTKSSIAVRVSLSSEADAQRLVQNGGCFYGTKCRVTHYTKTPWSSLRPSPSLC